MSRFYRVLTNVKDVVRDVGRLTKVTFDRNSLALVGLALTTRLVSDIWFDLFGRFCDFNLGLFVVF